VPSSCRCNSTNSIQPLAWQALLAAAIDLPVVAMRHALLLRLCEQEQGYTQQSISILLSSFASTRSSGRRQSTVLYVADSALSHLLTQSTT
jgi:hypothetical protein